MDIKHLTIISPGKAVKKNNTWEKGFIYTPCQYCDQWISNCGFATYNHFSMHLRKGDFKL